MNYLKTVKLVADTALFFDKKVLLVRYKDTNKYDHQKGWFLPDDYIAEIEHPDDTATRILIEQVGLDNNNSKIDHFESFTGDDKTWHLIFHYKLFLDKKPLLTPSADIDKYEWFYVNSLPADSELAHHGWARYVIQQIIQNGK